MNGEELQLLPVKTGEGNTVPIAYRYRKPDGNKPVFVWFPGFKSDMDSVKAEALSEWCRQNGAGCLRFDYSGHGQSGGRFEDGTIGEWAAQAAAVYKIAAPAAPAVFVGSSMGGWIALLLSAQLSQRAPKGVVLIAPAWDMTRLMWERASEEARLAVLRDGVYYRPSAYSDEPYAITKSLIDEGKAHLFGEGPVVLDTPVRIIHGRQDADVPWRHSMELLDVADCPDMRLTLVKDGEHRLSRPQDLALLFSTLTEFL